jgi:hypothetical protein
MAIERNLTKLPEIDLTKLHIPHVPHMPHYHYHPPHQPQLPSLSSGGGSSGGDNGGLAAALGASMALNPVGWAIGATVAVGALLYYAFKED